MTLVEGICRAREQGLSVAEIARVLHWKAGSVHDLLVAEKRIDHLPKEYAKADVSCIDGAILRGLKNQNISLARWAHGRGLFMSEVLQYLSQAIVRGDTDSERVHYCFYWDFPNFYRAAFGEELGKRVTLPPTPDGHYSVHVAWDIDRRQYVASFPELKGNDLIAPVSALERTEVYELAEKALKVYVHLVRFNEAIDIRLSLDDIYKLD